MNDSVAQKATLEDAEEQLRILSELGSDFVYMLDIGTDHRLHNRWLTESFERIFGMDYETMRKAGWRHWVHPEDHELAKERFRGLLEGREFDDVIRVLDGEGNIRYIRDRARPMQESEGRVGRIYGVASDVTEARLAEERLERREQTYRRLLEAAPMPILVHCEEEIVFANPAAATALAADGFERLIGQPIWVLIPETEEETMAARLRSLYAKDGPAPLRPGLFRRLDGALIEVQEVGNSLDYRGRPAAEMVFHDVTETNRALREHRALQARHERAKQLESLGTLAAGIAHDFNNILVGVLGHADLALELLDPEGPLFEPAGSGGEQRGPATSAILGIRHHIDEIGRGAQHAADIAQQLLDYAGEGRFKAKQLSLSNLVGGMRELMNVSVKKYARITYSLAPDLPTIEADPTQLKQVLMNLVMNAAEASLREGEGQYGAGSAEIRVSTGLDEGPAEYSESFLDGEHELGGSARRVYIEVADDGIGMDETTRRHLFEPFYTTKPTGRGLGMATVLGIVRAHHGALDLDTEPGRGTTIRAAFPLGR